MSIHHEISFESEICQHLAENGWLYAEGDAATYDRKRAIYPPDVLAWVQETQPKAWETLVKNHGAQAEENLLARLRDQLDQRGTLDVLRHGIELLGLKQPLKLAEFKPALAINQDILARYAANRLRVIRQVRYSLFSENSIDLVLFINGSASGDGGVEDGLHPKHRRRDRPISFRPPPAAEGSGRGATAVVS